MFDLYQGLQMGFTQQVTLKLSSETSWYSPNCWIIKKARELKKNIYFCFIDYLKAFDCVDQNKLWKILKEWEDQTTWPASCEICMQIKKQQLELDMEQQTGSK